MTCALRFAPFFLSKCKSRKCGGSSCSLNEGMCRAFPKPLRAVMVSLQYMFFRRFGSSLVRRRCFLCVPVLRNGGRQTEGRTALRRSPFYVLPVFCLHGWSAYASSKRYSTAAPLGAGPVSYTHLDVYKRQRYMGTSPQIVTKV